MQAEAITRTNTRILKIQIKQLYIGRYGKTK